MRGAGRVFAVLAAVLLAGAATYALANYIRGLEDRAFAEADLVEVLVAVEEIPAGTSATAAGEAGSIQRGTIPTRNLPANPVTSLDQLAGRVAEDRIFANEVLVDGRWVDSEQVVDVDLDVPEGFEAISVQVGVPSGVAGFVRDGDRISLIATSESSPGSSIAPDGTITDDAAAFRSQYLLQGIEVLSVGQRVTSGAGEDDVQESGGQVLLTVALEPSDAERLVFAIESASLYFTLLPEDAEPADTTGRSIDDLFDE